MTVRYSNPAEWLRRAELAMGSTARVMEDWQMTSLQGGAAFWRIDMAIKRAGRDDDVRRLIWC